MSSSGAAPKPKLGSTMSGNSTFLHEPEVAQLGVAVPHTHQQPRRLLRPLRRLSG
jgi:hypothetical protein